MSKISVERFIEIMDDDELDELFFKEKGCNAVKGLLIIQKYLPGKGVEGADHDVIYSVSVDQLIKSGITEEDVTALRVQNWMIDADCMACFV